MKNIKFRGRDENGKWHYGFYCVNNFGEHTIFNEDDSIGKRFAKKVSPNTVGQFSGLLDKNKKEIYTGDIFRDDEWSVYKAIIEFYNGMFGWWSDGNEEFIPLISCEKREVIGNIYENNFKNIWIIAPVAINISASSAIPLTP